MFSVKKFRIVSLFSLLLMLLSFSVNSAQDNSKRSIAVVSPWFSEHNETGKIVAKKIEALLNVKGYKNDDLARFAVIVIPWSIPESDKIIITYLFARSLPEEILKFNKENETAFLNAAKKTALPKEGKVVREYLTQEELSKYRRMDFSTYCNTVISDNSKLERDLEKIVEQAISAAYGNN